MIVFGIQWIAEQKNCALVPEEEIEDKCIVRFCVVRMYAV